MNAEAGDAKETHHYTVLAGDTDPFFDWTQVPSVRNRWLNTLHVIPD